LRGKGRKHGKVGLARRQLDVRDDRDALRADDERPPRTSAQVDGL
jgi:hypothetical protein